MIEPKFEKAVIHTNNALESLEDVKILVEKQTEWGEGRRGRGRRKKMGGRGPCEPPRNA